MPHFASPSKFAFLKGGRSAFLFWSDGGEESVGDEEDIGVDDDDDRTGMGVDVAGEVFEAGGPTLLFCVDEDEDEDVVDGEGVSFSFSFLLLLGGKVMKSGSLSSSSSFFLSLFSVFLFSSFWIWGGHSWKVTETNGWVVHISGFPPLFLGFRRVKSSRISQDPSVYSIPIGERYRILASATSIESFLERLYNAHTGPIGSSVGASVGVGADRVGVILGEKSISGSEVGGGEVGGGDFGIASGEVESAGVDGFGIASGEVESAGVDGFGGEVGEEDWFDEEDDVGGCGDLGDLGVRAFGFVEVVVEDLLKFFRLGLSFCFLSSLAFRWHPFRLSWLLEHLPGWIH